MVTTKPFKRGEENFAAILTPELVQKMRKLQAEGWSYRKLSDEFDVDPKHAWRICKRLAWSWVD
jgi:hypothetical protein